MLLLHPDKSDLRIKITRELRVGSDRGTQEFVTIFAVNKTLILQHLGQDTIDFISWQTDLGSMSGGR